jgi:superfamily II DNA/RNA helicase
MSFDELGLSPTVLKAVADSGYTEPTEIQQQAIPLVLTGRDIIGVAQTGTGKTASFTLPMIESLASGRARARMPRSLILEPTRELAAQVADSFDVYGKYHKLTKALLIGGVAFGEQQSKLDRGVDVLIATPGRLIDHVERGGILLADIKTLVIDEADRMLDMGFIPDVEKIFKMLPRGRQTLMFSATMPAEIRRLADTYLSNPMQVEVAPPATAAKNIVQGLIQIQGSHKEKRSVLRDLIRGNNVKNALIFCNRKKDVTIVSNSLRRHDFDVAALHGDMVQSLRTETLDKFKSGGVKLVVASDVAARGLDVANMSHVFNYDVPTHADDYVHRIGRTGRAGKEGHAYTLATSDDSKYIGAIEKLIGTKIPRINVDGSAAANTPDTAVQAASDSQPANERARRRSKPRQQDDTPKTDEQRKPSRPRRASEKADSSDRPASSDRTPSRETRKKATSPDTKKQLSESRNRGRDRNETRSPKNDGPVTGMGDHVPDFMRRR